MFFVSYVPHLSYLILAAYTVTVWPKFDGKLMYVSSVASVRRPNRHFDNSVNGMMIGGERYSFNNLVTTASLKSKQKTCHLLNFTTKVPS